MLRANKFEDRSNADYSSKSVMKDFPHKIVFQYFKKSHYISISIFCNEKNVYYQGCVTSEDCYDSRTISVNSMIVFIRESFDICNDENVYNFTIPECDDDYYNINFYNKKYDIQCSIGLDMIENPSDELINMFKDNEVKFREI